MKSNIKATMLVRFTVGCLFLVLIYLVNPVPIFSAFVGFMASFIPEAYQGWKLSKTENEYEPNKWLRLAYQSMIAKWLMTAMIFGLSFSSDIQWDYKILFAGYLLVSISGLLTPIFKGKK